MSPRARHLTFTKLTRDGAFTSVAHVFDSRHITSAVYKKNTRTAINFEIIEFVIGAYARIRLGSFRN